MLFAKIIHIHKSTIMETCFFGLLQNLATGLDLWPILEGLRDNSNSLLISTELSGADLHGNTSMIVHVIII